MTHSIIYIKLSEIPLNYITHSDMNTELVATDQTLVSIKTRTTIDYVVRNAGCVRSGYSLKLSLIF